MAHLIQSAISRVLNDLNNTLFASPCRWYHNASFAEGAKSGLSYNGEEVGPVARSCLVQRCAEEPFSLRMGRGQGDSVATNVENGGVGERNGKTAAGGRAFVVIAESDCCWIVEEEVCRGETKDREEEENCYVKLGHLYSCSVVKDWLKE